MTNEIDDHEKPRYTTRRLRHEIDAAVAAERERIIAIARDYQKDAKPGSEYRLACEDIIEAIREGA